MNSGKLLIGEIPVLLNGKFVEVNNVVPRDDLNKSNSSLQGSLGSANTKKIFVGGLVSSLTVGEFTNYFAQFGTIVDSVVMYDQKTQRPRGFGFITYDSEEAADRVLQRTFHELYGKVVEVKAIVPKRTSLSPNQKLLSVNSGLQGSHGPARANNKKIFVGGLASSVIEAEFKNYFSQFGRIADGVVMYDHKTQRPRGFGFITYESEEAVDRVLQRAIHELDGKVVEVKASVPKQSTLPNDYDQRNNKINSYSVDLKALPHQPLNVSIEASGRDFQFYKWVVLNGQCGTDHRVAVVGYGSSKCAVV